MDSSRQSEGNGTLSTIITLGVGGIIVWNLLPPEAKDKVFNILYQVVSGLAAYQRQREELERQRHIEEVLAGMSFQLWWGSPNSAQSPQISTSLTVVKPSDNILSGHIVETDTAWRSKIVHPSVVLILGKRGSGKSALGYRLLGLFRYIATPYVVGVPSSARSLLPDWIGIVPTLEELPNKSIALVDEAYLAYHARGSMAATSKAMSQALNLSRQKEQTLIFVSQEARQVDKNIASSANVVVFKELGMLQLEFDRPELNKLANQAKEALVSVKGDKRRWSFVYAPDADHVGLMENELPSFWKPSLSHMFASGISTPTVRIAKGLTLQQKIQKAKEMREQGASYSEIAGALGVSIGTVVNYLRGYPYRQRNTPDN